MKNFNRLTLIFSLLPRTDPRKRKYMYLKLLEKEIIFNYFSKKIIICIPKQESSQYFRYTFGRRWKKEYKNKNGIRYKNVYSHFSEEIFFDILEVLEYRVEEMYEDDKYWKYCIINEEEP